MEKYIIDTKSNDKYFVILKEDGTEFVKISKKCNTLESVKRFIGVMNIKEVIFAVNSGVKKMIETRKNLGLTQYDLADKTGVNRSTIASIESGINTPSVATAKVLANYLKFDWTLFFEEVE